MNRLTLVLNAAILVVTFVVALTAGDVQGQLLDSAIRTAGRDRNLRTREPASSTALLRVVQSMDNYYPATAENALTSQQLVVIQDAIDLYYSAIRTGIDEVTSGESDSADVRGQVTQLGRTVRVDLESVLGDGFSDPSVVRRLTTEIIRSCH